MQKQVQVIRNKVHDRTCRARGDLDGAFDCGPEEQGGPREEGDEETGT